MKRGIRAWQQVLGANLPRLIAACLSLPCFSVGPIVMAADIATGKGYVQTFAVALPEKEGPVTIGVFSGDGSLVRMLYLDTPVESIPAGLNGLLVNWDGRDDSGLEVPPGTYRARGLVHGAITRAPLVQVTQSLQTEQPSPPAGLNNAAKAPGRSITPLTVKAPPDALYEERPLNTITIESKGEVATILANGLPLITISPGWKFTSVRLVRSEEDASVMLAWSTPEGERVETLSGLNGIVPMEAGTLEIAKNPAGAFPSPDGSKESIHAEE